MDATMQEVMVAVQDTLHALNQEKPIGVATLYAAMMVLAEQARVQHETDYQEALAKARGLA